MTISISKNSPTSKIRLDGTFFIPLFLILSLIALINTFHAYNGLNKAHESLPVFFSILLSKSVYCWYFTVLALGVQWLSKRILFAKRTFLRWLLIHLITLLASFLVHETLTLGVDTLIWGPQLKASLLYILFNNPAIWIEIFVYILFLLSFSLLEYRRMSQENDIRCSQLEVQLIRSRLQEIRSRIQPTFLFNTLRTILNLIQEHRNKDANHILSLLSDFLRTTVYDNERDEITLEEEIRFLNQYLEIEQVRSSHSFTIQEEIDRTVSNAVVPNFILQPIVEELIYRNSGQDAHLHEIYIKAFKADGPLELIIEYRELESGEESITGEAAGDVFEITRERLMHLYGDQQSLTVQLNRSGGAQVKVQIPFKEINPDSEETFMVESAS
ncbi:MAG: hypothetical protein EHM64_13865 [Ignavibacteriae bacterium]|nr:MAG: hypothetical protein EHM64_13865 [Ignavibacteriota bacterium]